jgi:hypothetical protein
LSKGLLQNKVKLHYKLPTNYNNGDPIPDEDIIEVKNFFVDRYNGLSIDSPSEGYWKEDGFVYQDTNLEFSIIIPKTKFKREVKNEIPKHLDRFKKDFQQLAILCYYHDVMST